MNASDNYAAGKISRTPNNYVRGSIFNTTTVNNEEILTNPLLKSAIFGGGGIANDS